MKSRFQWAMVISGLAIVILASSVLIGWSSGNTQLVKVISSSAPMQFNTALGFLLCGAGIATVFAVGKTGSVPMIAGVSVVMLSGITLLQSILSIDFGIDTLFLEPFLQDRTDFPGRMSTASSLCFILAGLALIFAKGIRGKSALPQASGLISAILFSIAATALLGYVARLTEFHGWVPVTKMAVHTTVGFIIISVALTLNAIRSTDLESSFPGWFKIAVFISTFSVSICFSYAVQSAERMRNDRELNRVARSIADDTQTNINLGELAVKRIADRWKRFNLEDSSVRPPDWDSKIAQSTREFTPLKAISLIDRDFGVQWIDPPTTVGIENIIRDTDRFISALATLTTSLERNEACSIVLPDPEGIAPAVIVCEPVSNGDERKFIAGLFSPEVLFHQILTDWIQSNFHVVVESNQGVVFQSEGNPIALEGVDFGSASVPSKLAPWTVTVVPSPLFLKSNESYIPAMTLVFGFLLSMALTSAVHLKEKANLKTLASLKSRFELKEEIDRRRTAESALKIANRDLEKIVAQKSAELIQSGEKLRLAINGSRVGTWHYDLVQDTIEFSERTRGLFGLRKEDEISYELFKSLLHTSDLDRVSLEVEKAIQEKTEYDIEYRIVWPNGEIHWVAAKGRAFYDEDGLPLRMEGIVIDIDEQKESQEVLKQVNDDMATMLHVLSHDLKEPVRSIINFSEIVIEDFSASLNDTGIDYLNRLNQAGKRLNLLLDDVLQLSKTRSMPDPSEEVSLIEILEDVIEQNSVSIEDTGATITVGNDFPKVTVSRPWATQAIHNLLSNALKFAGSSGPPEIEIIGFHGRTEHGLVVSDNGPGVPAEISSKIFQLFQRGVDRSIEGTGIGLAIVKQVAERHGGHAWCEPRESGGTRMYLTFSRAKVKGSQNSLAEREREVPILDPVLS